MVSNVARKCWAFSCRMGCAVRLMRLLSNLPVDRLCLLSKLLVDRLRLLAKSLVGRARSLSNVPADGPRLFLR